jgi:hypothetical protein
MAGGCRYIGLDIHKNHVMVAAIDAQQRVILQPRKISIRRFPEWVADPYGIKTKTAEK